VHVQIGKTYFPYLPLFKLFQILYHVGRGKESVKPDPFIESDKLFFIIAKLLIQIQYQFTFSHLILYPLLICANIITHLLSTHKVQKSERCIIFHTGHKTDTVFLKIGVEKSLI